MTLGRQTKRQAASGGNRVPEMLVELADPLAGGAAAIDKLARSAKVYGPIAFSFGAGLGLALVALVLRASDHVDYATLKLACVIAIVLIGVGGGLALLNFWIKGRLLTQITEKDLAAAKRTQDAAETILLENTKETKDPLL